MGRVLKNNNETIKKKKRKNRLWLLLLCVGLFLLAVAVVFAAVFFLRQENKQEEQPSGPTLPRVSFLVEEHKVNTLAGYVTEMDIASMRDTITPVAADGQLVMEIETDGQSINALKYEICSLDGSEQYAQKAVGSLSKTTVTLSVREALERGVREAVLKVTLQMDEKEVYYYTRLEPLKDLSVGTCIEFAKNLHEMALVGADSETLEQYLEPGEESDNTTLQTVNIHSNVYHICWGKLKPQIVTEPEWSIQESNTVYTSILATYQVICLGDNGEQELYNVREFFRVRLSEGEMYLLDYERTMNQVFAGGSTVLGETSLRLGTIPNDVVYETNSDGTIVCFVQERELWSYNSEKNRFVRIFGFADTTENQSDVRLLNDEHDVRMIRLEENGSVTFAVYGYMNSGTHEGEVGVDILYYDAGKETVEEKVFLPSTKAFAITEYELGKMVYYSEERATLYVLTGGVLYQVDMKRGEKEMLAEGLQDGQYVASEDGHLLAWQTDGQIDTAKTVTVMNFETEKAYDVNAPKGETIKPLGFVFSDFVCGYLESKNTGYLPSGEETIPMHRLEIRSQSNTVVKDYKPVGLYISDIVVENNLITVNRVEQQNGIYNTANPDYISNNEERKSTNINLETYTTDLKESQKRFIFTDGIQKTETRVVRASFVYSGKAEEISFENNDATELYYVYAAGRPAEVCENAGDAVRLADEWSGIVTTSKQSYVWEKGYRDLAYYTDVESCPKEEGQSSMESCLSFMEQYGAQQMDLSGCTLTQILYVVNQGMPVIAVLEGQHAVLVTGYGLDTVTYVDPDSGREQTVSQSEMGRMVAASGNTFIGFVK